MTGWVDGTAILTCNLCAWVIWGAAIVQVVRTPAERYVNRWRTKVGRLAVIGLVTLSIGGLFLPFGAAAVLAGMRRAERRDAPLESTGSRGPQLFNQPPTTGSEQI